jgi:hypothetical protein
VVVRPPFVVAVVSLGATVAGATVEVDSSSTADVAGVGRRDVDGVAGRVVVGAIVTGTSTAGTRARRGSGSGRTARYSREVTANTPVSTSVDVRGRPVTVAVSGQRRAAKGVP